MSDYRNGDGTELDRAIDKLEDVDWGEESSTVNVVVQPPGPLPSKQPKAMQAFAMLPGWGKVVVILSIIAAAVVTGLAAKLLGAFL